MKDNRVNLNTDLGLFKLSLDRDVKFKIVKQVYESLVDEKLTANKLVNLLIDKAYDEISGHITLAK